MPIYEFQCPDCLQKFDMLSSFGTEEQRCQNCGKTAKRSHVIPLVTVKYNVPGFYRTRYMEKEE